MQLGYVVQATASVIRLFGFSINNAAFYRCNKSALSVMCCGLIDIMFRNLCVVNLEVGILQPTGNAAEGDVVGLCRRLAVNEQKPDECRRRTWRHTIQG